MTALACDVAVIGGSLGGVAAALAAADAGKRVILTEACAWVGGQITSQGVSALDEHPYIEQFGGALSYTALRAAIRADYRQRCGVDASNPGGGWVSRLCFAPRAGLRALEALLAEHTGAGRLTLLLRHMPVSARVNADTIQAVTLRGAHGKLVEVRAAYFLDATDLGDLLPLAGVEYVTGAESQADTGEPGAPAEARPHETQAFTVCFAVEYAPGGSHVIPRPPGYDTMRDAQPFTLTLRQHDGGQRTYRVFDDDLPFWTYRRIHDGALLGGNDIALINWPGNDYYGAGLIDQPPVVQARALAEARALSLAFLHWLQTECPRDDGGRGYPELRLRPDVMGTADGLAQAPYIRESRRIRALTTVRQQDIAAGARTGTRARLFPDSVGVGWYAIDLHACVGNPDAGCYTPTLPFQIPLGALLPARVRNLIAACKNIGTTHLTNGAYRLHPVEWAVGEAAGTLAAYAADEGGLAAQRLAEDHHRQRAQARLLRRGVPLAWAVAVDVPPGHPLFLPSQLLLLGGTGHAGALEVLDQIVERLPAAEALGGPPPPLTLPQTWVQVCDALTSWAADRARQ